MVLVLYSTVATNCIHMGYTVCILGFLYLQSTREKPCTQVLGHTGAEFCIFSIAKGGGKMMHINQTFLLFMNEGKAQFECWAVA